MNANAESPGPPNPAGGGPDPRLTTAAGKLAALRAGARRLLVVRAAAPVAAAVLGAAVLLGVLDYFVRFPVSVRVTVWAAGVVALAAIARTRVLPAWRFRPSLTEVALRYERTDDAARQGLRGVLASALEFSTSEPTTDEPNERDLRARVIDLAGARISNATLSASTLVPSRARRSGAWALGALVGLAGVFLWSPTLATIGARRVFTPWTSAEWPKRTAVADATGLTAHAVGMAVPLRAVVARTDGRGARADVRVSYRVIQGTTQTQVRTLLLTAQGKHAAAPDDRTNPVEGELFERLIEPSTLSPASAVASGPPAELEYWFQTDDDRTRPRRVRLVEPPSVTDASATVTLPAYAADLPRESDGSAAFIRGPVELGPGRDERATLGPILAGSRVEVTLTLNKPLTPPADLADVFSKAELPADLVPPSSGQAWKISWTAARAFRLPLTLTDEHGIRNTLESAYQFNVTPDQPASATVIEPAQDEAVLPTAVIPVIGEGRDDVGLREVWLTAQSVRPPPGSPGAPAEALGNAAKVGEPAPELTGPAVVRTARVRTELDLSALNVKPRDEVWLRTLAQDRYEHEGTAHDPGQSPLRRLRIISEAELIEQVRSELASLRQAAIRLDKDQADAIAKTEANAGPAEVRPLQEGITQRLLPQGEAVDRLASRVERNGLADRALTGLLRDSRGALTDAAQRAADAAQSLQSMERAGGPPEKPEAEALAKAQRDVRDQLGQLITMLDRGQDGWTARRELQRLLEDQNRLSSQTRAVGQQTAGRSASELTAAQRAQIDQLAQEQQDLARRSAAAVEDLAARGDKAAKSDPTLAQSMKQAAQAGQRSRLAETQRDAAEQVRQNQTSSATQNQQQASKALEQMLAELDNTEQNRDEALKRLVEEAIEAIDALIATQEEQLAAAAEVRSAKGLDPGMIALHGATLAVADRVRTGFRELADVADLLDQAAEAQNQAVTHLRADVLASAVESETESLGYLREARKLAEEIQNEAEDRDKARQRQELRKAYRDALERQVSLRGETEPFVDQELDRRQRAAVRALGERQQSIHDDLASLREKTEDLAEAKLFDLAHRRLDERTAGAARLMREGSASGSVDRDQRTSIRVLQSLVEALKENKNQKFQDGQSSNSGGGNGSGQGGPLIPPLAELRLLRLMQQEAADLTREVGRRDTAPTPAELDEVAKLQQQLFERADELINRDNQDAGDAEDPEEERAPENRPKDGPGAVPLRFEPASSRGEQRTARHAEPPQPPPGEKPSDDATPTPPAGDPVPSLDDLLGLPTNKDKPQDGNAGEDPADAELDRLLSPAEASGELARTVNLMKQAATRLNAARDPGVTTQRLQDEVLRKLDQIIASAEQNQQQTQSKSRSRSQQQQQQQQQQQRQQPSQARGDNRGQVPNPPRQDGEVGPPRASAGAAWGNLPEHVRDALVQGLGDKFSSLYQSMTEAYYRRLAEQPKREGTR